MDTSIIKNTARPLWRFWKKATQPIFVATFPKAFKQHSELAYWNGRFKAENGALGNRTRRSAFHHRLWSDTRGLQGAESHRYRLRAEGQPGVGERSAERVGLDPLVGRYLRLGASRHAMRYVEAPSEHIPFTDGYFDIVTCLNALDHVDDLQKPSTKSSESPAPVGCF